MACRVATLMFCNHAWVAGVALNVHPWFAGAETSLARSFLRSEVVLAEEEEKQEEQSLGAVLGGPAGDPDRGA